MIPEELAFKMAEAKWGYDNRDNKDWCFKTWDELNREFQETLVDDMRIVLCVVLKAIEDGEVVGLGGEPDKSGWVLSSPVLKPDFQKFLEVWQ
jgi:hypothetical protein